MLMQDSTPIIKPTPKPILIKIINKMLDYCIFVNPFMIFMAFSLFFLCKDWKFSNKIINAAASVTLYMYVIHENHLFANYVRPKYFAYIYENHTYDNLALYATLFALVCYLASMVLGVLYKYTIGKVTGALCGRIENKLKING